MKKYVIAILLTAFVFIGGRTSASAQTTSPSPTTSSEKRSVQFYNGFIGRWEGDFRPTPSQVFAPHISDTQSPEVKDSDVDKLVFSITGSSTKIYTKSSDGTLQEIKPDTFIFYGSDTNAVIFSITSGEDADGGWVETWNFTITHKERDSLQVVFTRAVNNFSTPSDYLKKDAGNTTPGRFFGMFYGEMTRPDTTSN